MSYNPKIKNLQQNITNITGSTNIIGTVNTISSSNIYLTEISASALTASIINIDSVSINIQGKVKKNIRKISTNTILSLNDYIILADASTGPLTITMPLGTDSGGKNYIIKKIDRTGNNITIQGSNKLVYVPALLSSSYITGTVTDLEPGIGVRDIDKNANRIFASYQGNNYFADDYNRAIIYTYLNNRWVEEAFITGSRSTGSADRFGKPIVSNYSGDVILVGAVLDETGSNDAVRSGMVYVFRSGSTTRWREERFLTGTIGGAAYMPPDDQFGSAIAINSTGNVAAVATGQESSTTGYTFIFRSSSVGWRQESALTNSVSFFAKANSLALNPAGNMIVIGAPNAQSTLGIPAQGTVEIYRSSSVASGIAGGWRLEARLTGTEELNAYAPEFGYDISMNENANTILVSAPKYAISGSANVGIVYVFKSSSLSGWYREQIIYPKFGDPAYDNGIYGQFLFGGTDEFVFGNINPGLYLNSTGDTAYITRKQSYTINYNGGELLIFNSSSSGWNYNTSVTGIFNSRNGGGEWMPNTFKVSYNEDKYIFGTNYQTIVSYENNTVVSKKCLLVISKNTIQDQIENKNNITLSSINDQKTLISDGSGSWYIV